MQNNKDENRPEGESEFDDDTDEAIVLPKPTPEITNDNERKAEGALDEGAFEDVIDVDAEEVKAESDNQSSGRKH